MTAWEQGAWHWCSSASCFIAWSDHWQTMITGVLALGAGVAAVRAARAQIEAAKQEATHTRKARLRAARASMPATLSAVCDYAQRVAEALNGAWPAQAILYPDDTPLYEERRFQISVPHFPLDLLTALERLIEVTNVDAVAERLESILREVQVLGARTRKLEHGDMISIHYLSGLILQAAAIYARAESLFGYARRQNEGVDPADLWDRVSAALNFSGVHRDEVTEAMRDERARGLSPGEADTRPVK